MTDFDPCPILEGLARVADLPPAQAMPRVQALADRASEGRDPALVAHALAVQARVLAIGESFEQADARGEEALAIASDVGARTAQALALDALALSAGWQGRHSRALELLELAWPLACSHDDPGIRARVANTLGIVLTNMGQFDLAVRACEEGLEAIRGVAEDSDGKRLRTNLARALAHWCLQQRDEGAPVERFAARADRAIALSDEAARELLGSGMPAHRAFPLVAGADALLALGRAEEARAILDEAEALIPAFGFRPLLANLLRSRGREALMRGRPEEALGYVERARDLVSRFTVHFDDAMLYRLIATAHEEMGNLRAALDAHREFHRIRERVVLEHAEHQARALSATLDAERGWRKAREESERADRFAEESRSDPLTGIANRRRHEELASRVLGRASPTVPVSLVLVDIDRFKSINDEHSHAAGDAALVALARLLTEHCRGLDQAARVGGDEFAILVQGPSAAALALVQRIRLRLETLRVPALPAGVRLRLSAGIAETREPIDLAGLATRADAALYEAKRSGRDCVRVFLP